MKLDAIWTTLLSITNIFTFSPHGHREVHQTVLSEAPANAYIVQPKRLQVLSMDEVKDDGRSYVLDDGTPVIKPPQNHQEGNRRFTCTYPAMTDWQSCYRPDSRDCWLERKDNSSIRKDIRTDYENPECVPEGTTRYVGHPQRGNNSMMAEATKSGLVYFGCWRGANIA